MSKIPIWENLSEAEKYSPISQHNQWQVTYLEENEIFVSRKFYPAGTRFNGDTIEGYIQDDLDGVRFMIPESLKLHPRVAIELERARKKQARLERIAAKKKREKEKAELKKKKAVAKAEKLRLKKLAEKRRAEGKKWTCKICGKKYAVSTSASHIKKSHKMNMSEYKEFISKDNGKLNL